MYRDRIYRARLLSLSLVSVEMIFPISSRSSLASSPLSVSTYHDHHSRSLVIAAAAIAVAVAVATASASRHPRPSCTCREPSLQSEVNTGEKVCGW